jgi:hypothetical protein
MQSEQEISANQDNHQEELPLEKTKARPSEFYDHFCDAFPWDPMCRIYED